MERGDINRRTQNCLFGSEGGCLGEESFSAKKNMANICICNVVPEDKLG